MPNLVKQKLFTTQYYDDYQKGKRKFQQTSKRPTSPHRRNNPHPQTDFLEPRNLKEQDAQAALQHRVQRAVQDYVLKSIGNGNYSNIKHIMEHRDHPAQLSQSLPEPGRGSAGPGRSLHAHNPPGVKIDSFIASSLNILERSQQADKQENKRERGYHYKAAAKTYGDAPATPSAQTRYKTPQRKPLLNISTTDAMTASGNNKNTKRTHTPPTPPPGQRRPKSVAYEAQVAASRAGSGQPKPVLYRAKTAPVQEDEWEDVLDENDIDATREIKQARPSRKPSAATDNQLGPRMKAWVEGATEFEKDVAYNMLQTLNGTQPTPLSRPKAPTPSLSPRGRSGLASRQAGGRAPAATHVYVPPSPAPRQAVPSRNGRADSQVQEWMKQLREKLNLQEPVMDAREFAQAVSLPKAQGARHQTKPSKNKRLSLGIVSEDYRHENSHFMMTQPAYRRHFIIAPDWVSERQSHRRLQQQGWARKNRLGKGVGC